MGVPDPQLLNEAFNERFRRGDLEGMLELYEPNALLCPTPGLRLTGHSQIREQLKGLLALSGILTATQSSCVILGDLALLHATWQFRGVDAAGIPIELGGLSSKVARKGGDAIWRYAMDLPMAASDHGEGSPTV